MLNFAKWFTLILATSYVSILLLSKDYIVKRTVTVNAPVEYVFNNISTFPKWSRWSSWATKDPNMQNNYSGEIEGKGQINEWESTHPDVGSGRQEMIAVRENERVVSALDFGLLGQNESNITLKSVDNRTVVTWAFCA